LDISHLILKEINKSFGFEFGKFVLETYFEKSEIDYELLIYFATFYTITRLFELQNNEKLFEKFVEKYEKFLEFIEEMKTKQILDNNSKQNSEKYLVFDFDGVLWDDF
jgi:hypothetical protein